MATGYYDVLAQSYSEWTGLLVTHFADTIHNYISNLFEDAEAYAKTVKRERDFNFILGIFQRFNLGIKDWSIAELNTQIVVLRSRYNNLQALVDHTIESTLSIMATSRKTNMSEIEVPHISVASFVHKAFTDAGANVGCKYPLLFDKNEERVSQTQRFDNYMKAQEFIERQLKTTVKNFLPLQQLDGAENLRPSSPRRLSPRAQKTATRTRSLTSKNLQQLQKGVRDTTTIEDDITPDDSVSKIMNRPRKKKPTKIDTTLSESPQKQIKPRPEKVVPSITPVPKNVSLPKNPPKSEPEETRKTTSTRSTTSTKSSQSSKHSSTKKSPVITEPAIEPNTEPVSKPGELKILLHPDPPTPAETQTTKLESTNTSSVAPSDVQEDSDDDEEGEADEDDDSYASNSDDESIIDKMLEPKVVMVAGAPPKRNFQ